MAKQTSNDNETRRRISILDDLECQPCQEVTQALKKEIESGKLRVLQVTSDEALELLEEAGAGAKVEFPSALVEDDKGVRLCQIYHAKDITLLACGNEIIALREPPEEQPAGPQSEESPPQPSP